MRRGSASIAANPVLIGAATTLVVIVAVFLAYNANTGLPFVPTYQLKAEVPERGQPRQGQRRAHRRHARRRGRPTSRPVTRRRRHGHRRCSTLKLETHRRAAAGRLDACSSARARRSASSTSRSRAGTSSQGFEDGATIPLAQRTPQPVELDEFLNMFDDEDARGVAEQPAGLRRRASPAAAADLNRAIEALSPLLRDLVPVMQNLVGPADTQLTRFFARSGATARDRRAGRPRRRRSCSRNLDTTFTRSARASRGRSSRTRSPTGRPRSTTAIADFPQQRPFLANTRRLFRELQPGVAGAARPPRRTWPTRSTIGTPTLPSARSRSTSSLEPRLRGAASASPRTRWSRSASSDLDQHRRRSLDPTLAYLDAGPDGLQLRDAVVPQRRPALLSDGDRNGTWQRFIIIATPQGPNNEGGPSSAPANGGVPGAGQLPAHQPVPEHRLAGPAEGVRGRQRALPRRARRSSATCPGTQSATTEKTTRQR